MCSNSGYPQLTTEQMSLCDVCGRIREACSVWTPGSVEGQFGMRILAPNDEFSLLVWTGTKMSDPSQSSHRLHVGPHRLHVPLP